MKLMCITLLLFLASTSIYAEGNEQADNAMYKSALAQFEERARGGDVVAMHWAGAYYYEGRGVEPNYVRAKSYLIKSAAAGIPGSMIYLGYLYSRGLGVKQDCIKAEYWFEASSPSPIHQGWLDELSWCNEGF